ncbi:Phosphoribulokinase [Tritrichomonas foetus]|uniref:Phosphoribulokinase n=1 Tax=Tritrichomonas foetus TaxID=1144522 RepID=A0A1J4KFQ7_9EUKA|nr:Phosphoribulokinase [Tritrichomonas foetus]|eukprot:OHT09850.1 Phosphoribulokinase [Tritrichomonas foetus]
MEKQPLPPFTPSPDHFDINHVYKYWTMFAQRSTILFLASCAYKDVTGRRMKISHALDHSSFCMDFDEQLIDDAIVQKVISKFQEYQNSGELIQSVRVKTSDLIEYYEKIGYLDKAQILGNYIRCSNNECDTNNKGATVSLEYLNTVCPSDTVECVLFRGYLEITYEAQYIKNLKEIGNYDIQFESPGFFVRYPSLLSDGSITKWRGAPLQHKLLRDYSRWVEGIKSNSIENLNTLFKDTENPNDVIHQINEASKTFSRKELSEITEQLISGFPEKRLVTIAGPSSAGKSIFSRMIHDELINRGFDCLIFSMDNYYLDVPDTPRGPDGQYDFESIYALHIDMLVDHLKKLLKNESIPKRAFDFPKGVGYFAEGTHQLDPKGFLIIEGIHGLNPVLFEKISADQVTKIYVAPMTPISIDAEHIFRTPDLLLLRRIIRDYSERGYSPRKEIGWWPNISCGEARNITPNLRLADLFFNSALVYEIPALATVGIPLLVNSLNPNGPKEECDSDPKISEAVSAETRRLVNILRLFKCLNPDEIPHDSCIYQLVSDVSKK